MVLSLRTSLQPWVIAYRSSSGPDWPFDAPTNALLMPDNPDVSPPPQRALWYDQVKQVTGLDLQVEAVRGDTAIIRATVNDAVIRLRNRFRSGSVRGRHDQESIRYGSARNLTGMRPVWLGLSLTRRRCMGCVHLGVPRICGGQASRRLSPAPLFLIAFLRTPLVRSNASSVLL